MIKTEYPYIDSTGTAKPSLIKTYTDREGYVLLQKETNVIYGKEVVDLYPCRFTYEEVEEPVEAEEPVENIEE